MLPLLQFVDAITSFIERGGVVLLAIAGLTFIMWVMIFERLFFYKTTLGRMITAVQKRWDARSERKSWGAHKIRLKMISQVNERINQNLPLIGAMVTLCPLLGLLGTVTGMIEVFGVLSVTGGGDAKSMASGVSRATIPTMAGMVAALSGVFGSTLINRIADREQRLLKDHLTTDH